MYIITIEKQFVIAKVEIFQGRAVSDLNGDTVQTVRICLQNLHNSLLITRSYIYTFTAVESDSLVGCESK